MRWGDKILKGCKDEQCPKLHPPLCPKSLDLKCLDKACPHKLHAQNCVRPKRSRVISPENASTGAGGARQGGLASNGGVKAKSRPCSCQKRQPAKRPSYSQVAGKFGHPCVQGGGSQSVCRCSLPSPVAAARSGPGQRECQSDNSTTTSHNTQGFPWLTVQQPMLEAYMEKVVKESMEKLVRQLLTVNARQA